MCFFQPAPAAPQIIYQGPSQADLDANNKALEAYRQQSMAQQQQFSAALQKQIDDANAMAASQRKQLEDARAAAEAGLSSQKQKAEEDLLSQRQKAELDMQAQRAAASSDMAAQKAAAYGTAVTQAAPENAQITEAPKPKEKIKGTLKIAPGATALSQGSGLNIGV